MYFVTYGFDGLTWDVRREGMMLSLLLMGFNSIGFIFFHTFRGILRFSSFHDLMRIVYALVLGYALTYVAVVFLNNFAATPHISNVTFIAIFFFNISLMIFSRILVKEVYEAISGSSVKPKNVFIYGTDQAGISVAKALEGNNEFNYRVLGFISDENHLIGKD